MVARIEGITVELDANVSPLQNALRTVDAATRTTANELRQIEQGLRFNPESTELLAQRQQVLADQIGNTSRRLDVLRQAQAEVQQQFERGEIGADQYRAFQREIERTEGALANLQRRASQDTTVSVEVDSAPIERLRVGIDSLGSAARSAASVANSALSSIGTGAAAGAAGIGAAIGGLAVGFEETNRDLAILNTQLNQVGLSLNDVTSSTTAFTVVGQQTDQIAEAFGNLVAAGYTTAQQIDTISANIAGAIVRYGDTFTAEGIGESIALTTELGEASGQLVDLLEREGVNVDNFNASISALGTESERANLITETLANQGLAQLNEAFQTGNPALVAQAEASQRLQQNLSELSVAITPVLTLFSEFSSTLLDVVLGNKDASEAIDSLKESFNELFPAISDSGDGLSNSFLEGLREVLPEVANFLLEVLKAIYEGLDQILPDLVEVGTDIIGQILEGLAEAAPEILDLITDLLQTLVSTFSDGSGELSESGKELLEALKKGLDDNLPLITDAAVYIITQLLLSIAERVPELLIAGQSISDAVIDGIRTSAEEKIKGEIDGIINSIKKPFEDEPWFELGSEIVSGLTAGLQNATGPVNAIGIIARNVVNEARRVLDINSPSRVFRQIGEFTSQGMAVGIRRELDTVEGAARDLASTVIDTVEDNFRELDELESEQAARVAKIETDAARRISEITLRGKESKKGITRQQNRQIEQIEADSAAKVLEAETRYNEQRAEAESRLQDAKLEAVQNFISQQRDLNQISAVEEANLINNSLLLFEDSSEQRLVLQRQYRDALSDIYDEITEVNTDYAERINRVNEDLISEEERLTRVYTDQLEDRSRALRENTGLFEEFDSTVETTGRDLLSNLQSQVDGLRDWEEQFRTLSERAIDEGLLAELREIGPEALGQLQNLNSLTDDELTEYSELYRDRSAIARELAIEELAPLEEETRQQIVSLRQGATEELDLLNQEWAAQISSLTTVTSTELSSLEQIGKDAVQGLINGFTSGSSALDSQVEAISENIEETIRNTLQTRSPSRVTTAIGQDIVNGLIVGLRNREGALDEASNGIAQRVVSALNNGTRINIGDLISLGASQQEAELLALPAQINQIDEALNTLRNTSGQFDDQRLVIQTNLDQLNTEIDSYRQSILALGEFSDTDRLDLESRIGRLFGQELQGYQKQLQDLNQDELSSSENFQKLQQDKFNAQKSFVDGSRRLNRINIRQELDLYNEFQSNYSSDSEQFQYFNDQKIRAQQQLSRSILEVNNRYTANIRTANDNLLRSVQELENGYDTAFNGIVNTILGSRSIFEDFSRGERVSGQQLLSSLESQIRGINEYNSVINTLGARVNDQGFIDYLRTLGPESLSQLEGINSLSREELDRYVDLYNERFERAANAATIQLEGLRASTDNEISLLQQETAVQLQAYEQEWAAAITAITTNVDNEFSELPQTLEQVGQDLITNLANGLSNALPSLTSQLQDIANTISSTINGALDTNVFNAQIRASSQRLANATSSVNASLSNSVQSSQRAQIQQQSNLSSSGISNGDLINAINDLALRPINTIVQLDRRVLATAVSEQQYNNTAINALTRGVLI